MEVFRDLPCSTSLAAFCNMEDSMGLVVRSIANGSENLQLEDASKREFSDELRSILEVSAMTGLYWHNWDELRTLLLFRLEQVLQDYFSSHIDVAVGPPRPLITGESYQELEDRLTTGLKSFTDGAPFTLQRLCEILLNPRDRYPNLDKVALAFEKLLLVTSTIPPSPGPYPGIPSVPESTPTPALAKDADSKPEESPMKVNVDTNPSVSSKSNDGPVETDLKEVATASVAADAEMVDNTILESKEEHMDVDGPPQPSEMIAAEEAGSKENASEDSSTGKEEWHLVDAAPTETKQQAESAPVVDRNESAGGVVASRL